MNYQQFKKIRLLIIALVVVIMAAAVTIDNFYLAISGVLIGMLFLHLVRIRFKQVMVDERVISVSGKASRMTYVFITLLLGLLSLFFIFSGRFHEDFYIETLGVIFSYVVMLNIAIYAISYRYFNKKYGGDK
jgi:uncharacterized membrane protein